VKKKNWDKVHTIILTLTFDCLAAAAKSVLETGAHNDLAVYSLEILVQLITL
jgi:hypothetical protein